MVPVHLFLEGARAELSVLDAQREKLAHAIAAVERLHEGAAPVIAPVAAIPTAPVPVIVDELHEYTAPRDPVGVQRVETLLVAERKAVTSRQGDADQVLDLLAANGPMKPRAIEVALGLEKPQVKWLLTRMRQAGTIQAEGETHARVVMLAKPTRKATHAAREGDDLEPVWDGSTKRSPAEVLQARREAQA